MLRKVTSLTSFLSFVVTLFTSVVLYVVPQGRVAYWADWHFLGLSKTQWGDVHITVGLLFLVALFIHLWLNWKLLIAYMKNSAREMVVMTKPMIVSLFLVVFVFAGTLVGLPPMQQILDLGEAIKEDAIGTYGNPPYGHAELSPLRKFCGFLGFDPREALAVLKKKGYGDSITLDTQVRDIASAKGVSPQQVLEDIRSALGGDPFAALPESPPEGTGRLSLADLCTSFGLPMEESLARLATRSISATPDMTVKEIAGANSVSPMDVYSALRGE